MDRDRNRCEALVQGSAWSRPDRDLQCSRGGRRYDQFANVALCLQHMDKADRDAELELAGGRTLLLVVESVDEETEVETLVFQVVSNVSRIERARKRPPTNREVATELVVRHFGSAEPKLIKSFAENEPLMELAKQDMRATQRAIAETLGRLLRPNVVEFPTDGEGE